MSGWVFVGHASEIPRPGDYVTRVIGTEPVIMARAGDGQISVLVNRCRHRGTMVCPADRGHARTLTCPYHGWTYDLRGELLGVPYPGGYADFDKSANGLPRAPRVSAYRGFVFASLASEGISLAEHLGPATRLIDRSCDLSPVGEVELTAGWVRHRCAANWKMLPENDSDGYHLGFVHMALFRTIQSQYRRVVGDERSIKAVVRDWGRGHIEIVQPVSVEECVHWHTPMFWTGVPEWNGRLLRMAEAGMGPASFLMPDDLIIAGRNQLGLHARTSSWLLLGRGLNRETTDADGRIVSHVTDETTNRGFWRHLRSVMTEA
jgi:phenylpropionate dioxygenase-like ring-hydroxylating dioxygenase large terminal subunit